MPECLLKSDGKLFNFTVWQENSIRWLQFGDHVQTKLDINAPSTPLLAYLKAMYVAFELKPLVNNILLIGLGGGAMVHYILKQFPDIELTIVEKHLEIIDIAQQYFNLDIKHPNLTIENIDVFDYIKLNKFNYDLIFIDLPLELSVLLNTNFKNLLNANGMTVYNNVCYDKISAAQVMSGLHQLYQQQTLMMPIVNHMNLITLASLDSTFNTVLEQWAQKQNIKLEKTEDYGYIKL